MRIFLAATLCLSLAAVTVRTQRAPLLEKQVDALLGSRIPSDRPGVAVLVAKDGKVLLAKGYGLADVERKVPITPGTSFRIGSITKQFTAAAILKLQEQGKLRVQDPLAKYIPDWPRGEDVTVYHLLTHSSGIHDYAAKPEFSADVTKETTLEELVQSFKHDPYDFEPGKRFLYTNSDYVLLGAIVEKVSGLSYGDYLRRTFFEPLGMMHTGVYESTKPPAHAALGYSCGAGKVERAIDWNMARLGGAGALYSTIGDLYRWNEAVFGGELLSDASLKAAFTVVMLDGDDPRHPEDTGYGFGWTIDRLRGLREISHGGELAGFGSYLLRLPSHNLTVSVLLNCVPHLGGVQQWRLAREIAEVALGSSLPPEQTPTIATISLAALDAVVGRYDMGDNQILTVTREGNRVFAEVTGRSKFEIFPRSERSFFVSGGEAEATFVKNVKGQVIKAILKQAGGRIDAPKLR